MNLLISLGPPIKGYININPMEGKDFYNLEGIEPASCFQIVADGMIDYIPLDKIVPVLNYWITRLRHGGKIVVGGTDSMEVCRRYYSGEISTLEFNESVHGTHDSAWNFKQSQSNLMEITEVLQTIGLKIIKRKLIKHNYIIEAERP